MDLHTRTIAPLLLSIPLIVGAGIAGWIGKEGLLLVLLGLTALLIALAIWRAEVLFLRPVRSIKQVGAELLRLAGLREANSPEDQGLDGVAADLSALRDHVKELDARLTNEAGERQKLQHALSEIEERYVLAVERANDGIWEWDLRSEAVQFSARWKGMLGHLGSNIGRLDEWKRLVHPMDLDAVMLRFSNHLEGLTPYLNAEYRVLHGDGRYRWIQSRGTAIRHASGKPYRIVVMDNDVNERKEMEDTLVQAAEGLSSISGEDFYRRLIKSLSAMLGTRDNLICHVVGDPPTKARTLAYYSGGKFWENFEYDLEGTSCGAVIAKKETVYVPTGVCNIWPLEKQYDRDSYIGVPLFDSTGKIIGHFACMDGNPMRQDLPHLAIFKIFAVRAAAELERTMLRQRLEAGR